MKIGIFQKGLCIVLLPSIINAVLVLVLSHSLDQLDGMIDLSRRQIMVINTLSLDLMTTTETLCAGGNGIMNGSYGYFNPIITRNLDKLERDFNGVSLKLNDDASFVAARREMIALLRALRGAFIDKEDRSMLTAPLFVKLKHASQWVNLWGKESNLLNGTLQDIQSKFEESLRLRNKELVFIYGTVAAALVLNLVLACVLAVYFHRHIARRVRVLGQMAANLPSRENLEIDIGGQDELSDLAQEFKKVKGELAQLEEERTTLMQMMAHDVRSPLMAAVASTEVLAEVDEKYGGATAQGAATLAHTRRNLDSCLGLVNDLLWLESIENSERKPDFDHYQVAEVVASAVAKVKGLVADRAVSVENRVGDKLLYLDYDQIQSVLERMLTEAVSRSPRGASVTISSGDLGDSFQIVVRDSGRPLDRKSQELLFDKFYQVGRGDSQRAGLGLAPVRPLLALHGGAIGAESDDRGNTLWLNLPAESGAERPKNKGGRI